MKPVYTYIVLAISLALFIPWISITFNAKNLFLNSRTIDPLAMVHALFPWFWILLFISACCCIFFVVNGVHNKWIHIFLLSQISLFLFYTPWILSGYSVNPDTLWFTHVGISMEKILSGEELWLSDYGQAYPVSFLVTNLVTKITGANAVGYSLYVVPIFSAVAITILGYAVCCRFSDSSKAFVSMLFALPALHYFQVAVSARLFGFILSLTIMVFLLHFTRKSTALTFALMFVLIFTHPTSPFILGIFLIAMSISKLVFPRVKLPFSSKSILLLGLGWLGWFLYYVTFVHSSMRNAFIRVMTFQISTGLDVAQKIGSTGGSFIFPEISLLTLLVYASFVSFTLLLLVNVRRFNVMSKKSNQLNRDKNVLSYRFYIPFVSALLYLPFSFLVLVATSRVGRETYGELERGMTSFVLMASICVGLSGILQPREKPKSIVSKQSLGAIWLFFLFVSFPLISYSTAAYTVLPPSDGVGMNFVASYFSLDGKTISTFGEQHLAVYADPSAHFSLVAFPPNLTQSRPDIVVLRDIGFFRTAMRFDLSFETNRFTVLQDEIQEDALYNKVYSSPTFSVYKQYLRIIYP